MLLPARCVQAPAGDVCRPKRQVRLAASADAQGGGGSHIAPILATMAAPSQVQTPTPGERRMAQIFRFWPLRMLGGLRSALDGGKAGDVIGGMVSRRAHPHELASFYVSLDANGAVR